MRVPKCQLNETVVEHASWELYGMRLVFAWLMWSMLPSGIPFTDQPVPNGLGRVWDFTILNQTAIYEPLRIGFVVAVGSFALGILPRLTLGYATTLLVMVGTLENSQGAIGHHLQLVCLVAGAMWLGYFSKGQSGAVRSWLYPDVTIQRKVIHGAKLIIAVSYVTSACVKLIASGGAWIAQLPDISLQLIKTNANVYYDTLWAQTGWMATELPYWLANHPWLTRLFFSPGLFLELFAFMALLGRRSAALIGGGLLVMHLMVRFVMNLSFSAHEWLLVIFLINVPYWIWRGCGQIRRNTG